MAPPSERSRLSLADVLAPITVEQFASEYWGKRPLFIKGTPTKFASFFGRRDMDSALRTAEAKGEKPKIRATFDSASPHHHLVPQLRISCSEVEAAYAAGATVCVTELDKHDASLAAFARAAKSELGHVGLAVCNAYLSPHGCGFGMHFDARIASTLQIEGSKWWTFSSAAAVDWPPGNATYDEGRALYAAGVQEADWVEARVFGESDYTEVLLEAGDVLILPAGTWHKARAENHSLAVNLAFEPLDAASLIADMLRRHFESQPRWRAILPSPPGAPATSDRELSAIFSEVVELLRDMAPDAALSREAMGSRIVSNGPTLPATDALHPSSERKVDRRDVLQIPPSSAVYWHEYDGRSGLALFVDDHSIDVTGASRTFLRSVIEHRRFVAEEALTWRDASDLSWDNLRETLNTLLDEGVLEFADQSGDSSSTSK